MKDALYKEMYQQYRRGFSLEQVGVMYNLTRQSVHIGFKRRGYKLRPRKAPLPFLMFNGIKFTRRNTGYYGRTDGDRELMHRYVWEYYRGTIPDGYDIHHIDHNRENNNIDNLELYTKAEHASKFATGKNQHNKEKYAA